MCSSTGRKCDYIDTPDGRTRTVREMQVPAHPASNLNLVARRLLPRPLVDPSQAGLTTAERWYLNLFRGQTSKECTGYMFDDFWQGLVHRVSEQEPAVRHAAIATSSMHWLFVQNYAGIDSWDAKSVPGATPRMKRNISFSLQQCTKALVSLRQSLAMEGAYTTSSAHKEAVLVTCVMLVSLALFQGDLKAVTSHLRSGYGVLMEWQKVNFDGNPSGEILVRVFQELQLHRMTFSFPPHLKGSSEVTPFWQTIDQCRPMQGVMVSGSEYAIILGSIISAIYPSGFEQRMGSKAHGLNAALGDLLHTNTESAQKTLMERMEGWNRELSTFVSSYGHTLLPQDRSQLLLMELWTMTNNNLISYVSQAPDEMNFDSFLSRFQRINELAAQYLDLEKHRSMFSAKPMLLQVIYFCAVKCRDWHTRQEALRLMRASRRQEGLWGSAHLAALLELVIEQEHAGLTPDDVVPREARFDAIHPSPLNQDKLHLWCHRPYSGDGNDKGVWTHSVISP
jgi:hypothetical protein